MSLPFNVKISNKTIEWRVETFWEKEPETIEFINSFVHASFAQGSGTFLDIGANIGLYSLYAARLYPDMTVIAFEPDILNFYELVTNIIINNFKNIIPLYIAVDCFNGLFHFAPPATPDKIEAGMSGGQIRHEQFVMDTDRKNLYTKSMSMSMDYLFRNIPIDFIKIDVDGNEYDICEGLYSNYYSIFSSLQGILIEFNTDKKKKLKYILNLFEKQRYTLENIINELPNHSRLRRMQNGFSNIENLVFLRESFSHAIRKKKKEEVVYDKMK